MTPSRNWIAIVRWLLLGLACLVTLLALFVAEENWRGDRAWAATERELKANGEPLDFAALQPPSVPDTQNFFKAPLLAHLLYGRAEDPERKMLVAKYRIKEFGELAGALGKPGDLPALRARLKNSGVVTAPYTDSPAADILTAMQPMQPLLDELHEAARVRPQAALARPPNPFEPPIFDIDTIFRLAEALGGRAEVEIELGRVGDAYADIFTLQRFANGFAEHPANLLHLLVGVAMHGLAAGAIADGCQHALWSGAQLHEFQKGFDGLHALADFRDALRLERAQAVYAVDAEPKNAFGKNSWPWWLFHGWSQQNKVVFCRDLEREILSQFTADPDRISAELSAQLSRPPGARAKFDSPYAWVSRMAMANIGKILAGLGTTADQLRLASLECAIERYRLAHGRYPEQVNDLTPALLSAVPHGVFDGQPVHYGTRPEGGHQIYFLGQNGHDDRGKDDDIALKLPDAS